VAALYRMERRITNFRVAPPLEPSATKDSAGTRNTPHIHASLILAVAFALANTAARPACAFGAPAAPHAARRPIAIDSRQTLTYNRVA
jgi:hypothetical protein